MPGVIIKGGIVGPQEVLVISSVLPDGASTETKQDDSIVILNNIETNTGLGATEATVSTLALETGGNLESVSTSLTSIDGKLTACDTSALSTEAKQDNAITELQDIEADVEAVNTTLTTQLDVLLSSRASETTLADVKTAVENLDEKTLHDFAVNDVEEASGTITYIGLEDSEGEWYIKKIDTTSGTSIGHATALNNTPYGTMDYDEAWGDRATLIYGNYSEAF